MSYKKVLAFWIRRQSGNTIRVPLAEAIVIDLVIGHGWWMGWWPRGWHMRLLSHCLSPPICSAEISRHWFSSSQPGSLLGDLPGPSWPISGRNLCFGDTDGSVHTSWVGTLVFGPLIILPEWELGHFISLCFQFPFSWLPTWHSFLCLIQLWNNFENWNFSWVLWI